MGQQCSCLQGAKEERLYSVDVASRPPQVYTEQSVESSPVKFPAFSFQSVGKIQAVMKGYLERRQRRVTFTSITRVYASIGENTYTTASFDDPPSDYRQFNSALHSITSKLPAFAVSQPLNDGVQVELKPPIVMEGGIVYTGEWNRADEKHGRGTQIWPDGSKYEGYWQHGKSTGLGRLIHADGDVYTGQWKEDMACGQGTYHHTNGAVYEGEWREDKQHGFGVERWPDGAQYSGLYVNGKKQGKGKFAWCDGSQYEGEFQDNNLQGQGTYCWQDGRRYTGAWKNNRMDGQGVFEWADGRVYKGGYIEDKKEGYGEFSWPDGRVYKGNWHDGNQHGHGTYISSDNEEREGEWRQGKRVKWTRSSCLSPA